MKNEPAMTKKRAMAAYKITTSAEKPEKVA